MSYGFFSAKDASCVLIVVSSSILFGSVYTNFYNATDETGSKTQNAFLQYVVTCPTNLTFSKKKKETYIIPKDNVSTNNFTVACFNFSVLFGKVKLPASFPGDSDIYLKLIWESGFVSYSFRLDAEVINAFSLIPFYSGQDKRILCDVDRPRCRRD